MLIYYLQNFFKMPSVLEEKMTKGTNKKNVLGFYFLSTCAVTGLFTSCYLYFTYIVAEVLYSRKYMWNFSVTMALYVFIFIGKLFRYRLTDTSRRSTFITLIQFDSMCLALAGLGMAITNYHYDRSGLYGNKYLQTVAKLLVAKLVPAFYFTSSLNLMYENAVWLEIVSIVFLYTIANVPLLHKICQDFSLGDNTTNVILLSLCILTITAYSSNLLRNRLHQTFGIRQGCPLCDILLFATLTVYVYIKVTCFHQHQNELLEFPPDNLYVSVWDTVGLSTFVIIIMLCWTAFFQFVFTRTAINRSPNVHSKLGNIAHYFKRFLCSDVQCIFFASNQIIKV